MADPKISKVNLDGTVDVISSGGNLLPRVPQSALPPNLQAEAKARQPVDLPSPAPGIRQIGGLNLPAPRPALSPDANLGASIVSNVGQAATGAPAPARIRTTASDLGGPAGQTFAGELSGVAARTADIKREALAEVEAAAVDQSGDFVDVPTGGTSTARQQSPFLSGGGGGGGPRTVTKTDTKTKQQLETPESLEAVQKRNEARRAVVETEQLQAIESGTRIRAAQLEGARERESIEREDAARRTEIQQRLDAFMTETTAQYEEARDFWLNSEEDPDRFWANKSTASKIASILGGLISGLGAGFAGREDPFAKRMKQAIDNDIAAQRANIQKAGAAARHLDGAMVRFAKDSDNEMANLAAGTAASLKAVGMQVQQAIDASPEGDSKLALQKLSQELAVMEADEDVKRQDARAGEATTREQSVTRTGFGGGGSGLNLKGITAKVKEDRFTREDGGIGGQLVADAGLWAQTASDDAAFRKHVIVVEKLLRVRSAIDTMVRIRRKHGVVIFDQNVATQYETSRGSLIGGMVQQEGGGIVNAEEYNRKAEFVQTLAPKFSDIGMIFGVDVTLNQLLGLQKDLDRMQNTAMKARGVRLGGGKAESRLAVTSAAEGVRFGELNN